jgi:hypothetical protein
MPDETIVMDVLQKYAWRSILLCNSRIRYMESGKKLR